MLFLQIAVFTTALISFNQAETSCNKIQTNIFDNQPSEFENNVVKASRIVRSFFARDDVTLALAMGSVALEHIPFIKQFSKLIPLIRETLRDESDNGWRDKFTKAIAHETMRIVAESESQWLEATLQTIQEKIGLLSERNPDLENRKTIASIIHMELDKMINSFDLKSSLFRKYPLLGAPPLIQLSSLVAIFSQIARVLIPYEAKNQQISCKLYNTLIDYRTLTVHARLYRLCMQDSMYRSLDDLNENGDYNDTSNPFVIDLALNETTSTELDITDKLLSSNVTELIDDQKPACTAAPIVRQCVAELFPIDLFNHLCNERKCKKPTGFGWLTLSIIYVKTHCHANSHSCRLLNILKCNSYVKVFVNNKQLVRSPTKLLRGHYDPLITLATEKITKNATVRIELWDSGFGFWGSDALIQSTESTVELLLNEPLREGAVCSDSQSNSIETMSLWQDEYQIQNK